MSMHVVQENLHIVHHILRWAEIICIYNIGVNTNCWEEEIIELCFLNFSILLNVSNVITHSQIPFNYHFINHLMKWNRKMNYECHSLQKINGKYSKINHIWDHTKSSPFILEYLKYKIMLSYSMYIVRNW